MANVLNHGKQVRHGARNWVCVRCARHDTHLGAYSTPRVTMCDEFLTNLRRYYGVMVPSLFLVMGGVGFCVLNCILGGQALASIANISWTRVIPEATSYVAMAYKFF